MSSIFESVTDRKVRMEEMTMRAVDAEVVAECIV